MSKEIQAPLPFPWYVPTFHGDLKLESLSPTETKLRAYELTETEKSAVRSLATQAARRGWADEKEFGDVGEGPYRSKEGFSVVVRAPISKIQPLLTKALKPGRPLLHAVTFADGAVEEVRAGAASAIVAARTPKARTPKAGATVARPTVGCPTPEFPESEIRANRVLEAILPPRLYREYERYGAFVAVGVDTGHTYAVTHRERRAQMRSRSFRSLYDLTEDRALCVHDWTVPPPEEMLAIYLSITLPGNERAIRELPEAFH